MFGLGLPTSPKEVQKSLSAGFKPQSVTFLGAEVVDDKLAWPTVRLDTWMAWESCIPSRPESPGNAQHCPGSIPLVNARVGGLVALVPREKMLQIAGPLRLGEYVGDVSSSIVLPPAERLL